MSRFEGYAKEFIVTALERTPADAVSDIYVVSLFVSDERDNPGRPTVTVGFNTESRVASTTHAGDADEARWNVAFWLQNDLGALAGSERDSTGASLGDDWLRTVAPRQPDEPVGATDCDGEETSAHFVQLLVVITKQLHADGTIARLFGRPIPVLIHELEYYDEIAEQNLRRLR